MSTKKLRAYRLSEEAFQAIKAKAAVMGLSEAGMIEWYALGGDVAGCGSSGAEKKLGREANKAAVLLETGKIVVVVDEADDLPDELAVMKKKTVIPGVIRSSAQALRVAGDLSMNRKNAVPVLRPGQRK